MDLSLTTVGIIGLGIFIVAMFLRMPIAVAMLTAGFVGIWLIRGMPASLDTISLYFFRTLHMHQLSVIPLFLLMGVLAGMAGVSRDAYESMHKWLGHLPGGLAMATVGGNAAFGAVCGNPLAAAATFITAALPEMRRYGYHDELSLGCISAGSILSSIVPPSGILILYGILTEESIGALFIAGIFPGLLITFLFWGLIYFRCRANPGLGPAGQAVSWTERLKATKGFLWITIIFLLVIGGIYAGLFTPSEGGAIGAVAVFLAALIRKRVTWQGFWNCLSETGRISAMIMFLICGAMLFSCFVTVTEIPIALGNFIAGLAVNRWIILAAILLVYVITGFFMDVIGVIVISLPIVFPIIVGLGFDPIHFGILCTLTAEMGSISPPFGMIIFGIYGIIRGEVPMSVLFRGALPFLGAMFISLILLTSIPQISLFLPDLMSPYR